jgi:hypothetical protein
VAQNPPPREVFRMTAQVTVQVWDKPHVVTVYQRSKSVWIAAGNYKDKMIEVSDSSQGAAVKRWRGAATSKGR